MIQDQYQQALKHIEAWWDREDIGRALFDAYLPTGRSIPERMSLNQYWRDPSSEPDLDALVTEQLAWCCGVEPLAEHVPQLPHWYGGRGTPMNLAWYLGGPIRFTDYSVYVDPCVEHWEDFEIRFDPEHPWVKQSESLMHAQGRVAADQALAWLPDLGDALTVFSLLRGPERLMMDLMEMPDLIHQKIDDFSNAFIASHQHFQAIYDQYWPGCAMPCGWAPGTTYLNQCDFSTMISPQMFQEFVIPELRSYRAYLQYILWHLDGYEEVRHLPVLLQEDYLRIVQIQPGANHPPASSDQWMPVCHQIQEAGKGLYVYAHDVEQFAHLARELDRRGLMIVCTYPLSGQADFEHHQKLAEG